jgi:2-polyprenyl-3-methyl-5-hydroxy-6-metoxy-1,4-benzoquinol methylase
MKCKICNESSDFFYKGKILEKYTVDYFKCTQCGFIQTEEPYWLEDAYKDTIAQLDIGLISRNILFADISEQLILHYFSGTKYYLDYGGGYGMYVRLMRDKGFDFYRYDAQCENIFARYFDREDAPVKYFDIITAFEVLEHFTQPMKEISKIFKSGETLFFSTLFAPTIANEFDSWWYRAPISGQHISFYTHKSLEVIAKAYNKKLYSNGINFHILTGEPLKEISFSGMIESSKHDTGLKDKLKKIFFVKNDLPKRKSLQETDYKMIEQKLHMTDRRGFN